MGRMGLPGDRLVGAPMSVSYLALVAGITLGLLALVFTLMVFVGYRASQHPRHDPEMDSIVALGTFLHYNGPSPCGEALLWELLRQAQEHDQRPD
jgi:hypothetical protein